ncbi:hypothetical protein PPL_11797 [Heterostelium album PN500]|uniref:Superoxide dismutase copper/zinc binding domain-containing protein n=1 Tax=Heterostelium pallidum (strain ATCC 26659 / Pp 5 / PN500) TaxID=670386 RepID=D3BUH7_HETP5|nr:hypothetical protein PPL_11797 [Heterostelium album PN500]EFA74765.1 hypothetical protein PPL_11797 [Heterostelium album PN500]|eukprot:XP_020426899.1 hypothetical protein PPL_11797 [Heterostelium album PN500]
MKIISSSLLLFIVINIIFVNLGQCQQPIEYSSCQLQSVGSNNINGYVLISNYSGASSEKYTVQVVASGFQNVSSTVYATVRQYGNLLNTNNPVFGYNPNDEYNCTVPGCLGSTTFTTTSMNWTQTFTTPMFNLSPGLKSVVGRIFSLSTSPFDSNYIIAQCVLGIGNPQFIPSTSPMASLNESTNYAAISEIPNNGIQNGAVCYLQPTAAYPLVNGTVLITEIKNIIIGSNQPMGLNIIAMVNGTDGQIGISINQFGDSLTADGSSTGGVWGLSNQTHGLPTNNTRLYGDLGNICVYYNDVAYYNWTTPYIGYFDSIPNLLGRSIVIRSKPYTTSPTYDGSIMATCVIGLRENGNIPATKFNPNTNNAAPTCFPDPTTSTTTGPNTTTSTTGSGSDSGSFSSITTPFMKLTILLISVLSFILL